MSPSNAVLGHGPGAGVPHPTAGTSAPLPLPCYLKGFVFFGGGYLFLKEQLSVICLLNYARLTFETF